MPIVLWLAQRIEISRHQGPLICALVCQRIYFDELGAKIVQKFRILVGFWWVQFFRIGLKSDICKRILLVGLPYLMEWLTLAMSHHICEKEVDRMVLGAKNVQIFRIGI